jgi:riboflavin kinase/FMN adenylyltransferase
VVLYRSLDEVPRSRGRAIALGTFDGVHLGHRQVIGAAVERAHEQELDSCVVTFDPHPATILRPDNPPKLLSTLDVKARRVAEIGADEMVAIRFTRQFSQLSAEQFCEQVLGDVLGARYIDVGENFHFGHGAVGDAAMLASRSEFDTEVIGLVEHDGKPVSSTRIRALVESGEVHAAADLLGAPFTFAGDVVSGDGRGRTLDMPTANITPAPQLVVPANGVYAAIAEVGGRRLAAAVNVGVRPTFEQDGQRLVEAHLIDFDGDIYGQTIQLGFLERLRDELRFESAEELSSRMQEDVAQVRRIALSPQLAGAS